MYMYSRGAGEKYRFIYFLQVVPKIYKQMNGTELQTYQFSYTHEKNLVDATASSFYQPGLFVPSS